MKKIYDLSDETFTDQDDIVPLSGTAVVKNGYRPFFIVNTFAGNDIINADNKLILEDDESYGAFPNRVAFENNGTLYTAEGNDSITGIISQNAAPWEHYGILNEPINTFGGRIDTGDGNDLLTGIIQAGIYGDGIGNVRGGRIDTGDGDDSIIGISHTHIGLKNDNAFINTGNGKDTITGTGILMGIYFGADNIDTGSVVDTGKDNDTITGSGAGGIFNQSATLNTNDGDDIITGNGKLSGIVNYKFIYTGSGNDMITGVGSNIGGVGIDNQGTINMGNGENSINSQGNFFNTGNVFLGEGNDSIIVDAYLSYRALENYNAIDTGEGDDTITSTGVIYNKGIINTGSGDDSIIVNGGFDGLTGNVYGIYNNGGAIITGDGNDSIIANEGFQSGPNSSGAWFLGEGEDYIKGYGSGDFYGGNGNDTLELTPGTYTVGIWGESPIFTKGNQLMITSEFEKLKAGDTIYDFTSLTAGQIIVVA